MVPPAYANSQLKNLGSRFKKYQSISDSRYSTLGVTGRSVPSTRVLSCSARSGTQGAGCCEYILSLVVSNYSNDSSRYEWLLYLLGNR